MRCIECHSEVERLDNEHLLDCCGLTLHEYAIRHHQPLELLLRPDQVGTGFEAPAPSQSIRVPGEAARATLRGLSLAGLVEKRDDGGVRIAGDVRRLDLLLWDMERLADLGFRFRQEYSYDGDSHRVVARSYLHARVGAHRLHSHVAAVPEPPPPFADALAVYLAHAAELQSGYLMMPFAQVRDGRDVAICLRGQYGVECVELNVSEHSGGLLLRTRTRADSERLLAVLDDRLADMPGARERFRAPMPEATVTKELVFDAAHFITDHPAKCSNLHGGRYLLQVQVSGRIDPVTGCVVDYGYLKRVVNQLVVERFDHHTLNYAAPELAWRSSTEMICVYVWERLIDYLPGLSGLRLYETTQSWCDYRGPDLNAFQRQGSSSLLRHFGELQADDRRQALARGTQRLLRAVASGE